MGSGCVDVSVGEWWLGRCLDECVGIWVDVWMDVSLVG